MVSVATRIEPPDEVAGPQEWNRRVSLLIVLEDDPTVQEILRAVLWRNAFNAVVTATAEGALALGKHYHARDVSAADGQIPVGSGAEIVLQLRDCHPQLPTLFISGAPLEFWDDADITFLFLHSRAIYMLDPYWRCLPRLLGVISVALARTLNLHLIEQ